MNPAWIAAIATAIVAAPVASPWVRRVVGITKWWDARRRRNLALQRIAERLAYEDTHGYPEDYPGVLEHYLGGRNWRDQKELEHR